MLRLPIDEQKEEIIDALAQNSCVVIEAEPGAGKTTRVPLFAAQFAPGQIWVLEPRRLAAKLACEQIARSLRQPPGKKVGYQFRFDANYSAETQILFLTEGLFLRRLLSNPTLSGVSVVVLDEFHERHLHTDVALAWVRWLQKNIRPDLKLLIMSATLDREKTESALSPAQWIVAPGRRFPLEVLYPRPRADQRDLEDRVASVIREAWQKKPDDRSRNDILVFLPGVAEIRAVKRRLENWADASVRVVLLYGEMSKEEQAETLRSDGPRRVILSTNIAESSVTIDGVSIVIDSGVARRAEETDSGFTVLRMSGISQGSAIQRGNRAGRQGPGLCYRLYSAEEFARKPVQDIPEIHRLDFSEWILFLAGLLARVSPQAKLTQVPWLDPLPPQRWEQAWAGLIQLDAIEPESHRITPTGEKMLASGLPPRLAKILIESHARGAGEWGAKLGALFAEDLLPEGDLAEYLSDLKPERERMLGFRYQKTLNALREAQPKVPPLTAASSAPDLFSLPALAMSVFLAFPDRVGKIRGSKVELCSGEVLDWQSGVYDREGYLLVLARHHKKMLTWIPIPEDFLLEESHGLLTETETLLWHPERETVLPKRLTKYAKLTLWEEDLAREVWSEECARILRAQAGEGFRNLCDPEALKAWQKRYAYWQERAGEAAFSIEQSFLKFCQAHQIWSLREAREADFLAFLRADLDPKAQLWLEREVPEWFQLNPRRRVKIHYEENQSPWIESRLQDFFGLKKTPTIAEGRHKLTLKLLAPNQRPVQVTQDLESFWDRTYAEVRKELFRRYPRHAWPEDPRAQFKDEDPGGKK